MSSILAELQDNSIITSDAVVRLKSYIAGKSPDVSVTRRAVILADALNRAVDLRLPKFEEITYKKMKRLLLEHTANKPSFNIHCSDVFQAAIELKESGEHFFEELDAWLSANLARKVSIEQLIDVVLESHELMKLKPEMDFKEMIDAAEIAIAARSGLPEKATAEADVERIAETTPETGTERAAEAGEAAEVAMPVPIPVSGADEASEPYAVLAYFSDIFRREFSRKKFVSNKLTSEWKKSSALAAAAVILAAMTFFWVGKITDDTSFGLNDAGEAAISSYLPYGKTIENNEDSASVSNISGNERKIRMKATAYDLSVESCGKLPGEPDYGITSTGRKAEIGRTVAVDPEVIPLGSRLKITFPEEYSSLDGIYIAEDTGRLIKGTSIDIFFGEDNTGSTFINDKAMAFGVRFVDVTILDNTEKSPS